MSTPIGKKIRNIREAQKMGRQTFADKTGIPKNSLIGIEVGKHEPGAKALIAIANTFPWYTEYLLTGEAGTRQENPEILLAEREAGIVDNAKYLPLFSPDLKPEDMNTRKMKKLQKEFDSYTDDLSSGYQEVLGTTVIPPSKK